MKLIVAATTVCIVILVSFGAISTIKCPADSSLWCTNAQIAKSCEVAEQCSEYIWNLGEKKMNDKNIVNLTVYYETLCPDCQEFMSGELWKAYQSVFDIMSLHLVPYGNAKETWCNETKMWEFRCHHADECWGNLLHSCFLYFYPRTSDHLPFVHCMESDDQDDIKVAAKNCAQQLDISLESVYKCMNSRFGNYLQHQYAEQTKNLYPPHQYVPWVTLNGVHTDDIQNKAQDDLVKLICDTYQVINFSMSIFQDLAKFYKFRVRQNLLLARSA